MELWLIIAISTAVFSWISAFIQKIAVENKTNSFFLAISQAMVMILLSAIYIRYKWSSFLIPWEKSMLIYSLLATLSCAQFFIIRVRGEVLKYLSSSEYFISYRILIVIVLTGIGFTLFREALSYSQIVWLLIGFIGIILLFEEDKKLQNSRSWLRAIYLLFLSIVLWAIVQLSAKYLTLESSEIVILIFYEGIFLLILSGIFYRKNCIWVFSKSTSYKDIYIGVLFGVTIYMAAITNFLAFSYNGPIGLVTKILGYSVFIPIILSMIFYDEKMSYKKWIAFVLTIISIYYLN